MTITDITYKFIWPPLPQEIARTVCREHAAASCRYCGSRIKVSGYNHGRLLCLRGRSTADPQLPSFPSIIGLERSRARLASSHHHRFPLLSLHPPATTILFGWIIGGPRERTHVISPVSGQHWHAASVSRGRCITRPWPIGRSRATIRKRAPGGWPPFRCTLSSGSDPIPGGSVR